MKIKRLSVLFAVLLFVSAFCMAGCDNSSQAPEALVVSIYKVEKEQDEDGKVYITNYDLWKSYNVTPTQAIDLPDYDPEKEDKDSKISYENNYSGGTYVYDDVYFSGSFNGNFLKSKNKVQFIPSSNSIIFARERKKKTINFFYEGKNIKEYLDETQLENFDATFKDTYEENFTIRFFNEWFQTFFTDSMGMSVEISLYTKNNDEKTFCQYSITKYKYWNEKYYYDYNGGAFTLIKSTDVYIKVVA